MEREEQYGLLDLRMLMAERPHFPSTPLSSSDPFVIQENQIPTSQFYDMTMFLGCHSGEVELPPGLADQVAHNSTITTVSPLTPPTTATASVAAFGLEMEGGYNGSDGGQCRWPRQETLTLLEVRSLLHQKFNEANQKGPLWDEVSRIMREEYGYQRSGRKCREKFENLYKYYKKTKEGKAGKQDGNNYRFFRQLEALCGVPKNQASNSETHLAKNNILNQTDQKLETPKGQKLSESLTLSNSSEFETSSSEKNDSDLSAIAFMMNRSLENKKSRNENQSFKKTKKGWKAEMKNIVNSHMTKLMETQEAWMERMLRTIEQKEEERMIKEEKWRKEETTRVGQEFEFWANKRSWVEARESTLMESLHRFTSKELEVSFPNELFSKEINADHHKKLEDNLLNEVPDNINKTNEEWLEPEISTLIQLRSCMELKFQESKYSKDSLWEEIGAKMACFGYDRTAAMCKETWENISFYYEQDSRA